MFASLSLLHGEAEFSWAGWDADPSIIIGCGALLALYAWAVGPLRRKYGWAESVDNRQVLWFTGGVVLTFLSLTGPLHALSDYFLFSAHMVQHMLIMLLMPPMMLMGIPDWLIRAVLRKPGMLRVGRFLTHPLIAFAIYNATFIIWHFPFLYNTALENHNLHIVQHIMFMTAAVIMWWPVVNPSPELARMNTPVRLLYLFALGIPMSVVSALITLADKVLYPFYAEAPRVFSVLPALDDQQLGGLIMWVPGAIIFWGASTVIFMRWARREEREEWAERELIAQAASSSR